MKRKRHQIHGDAVLEEAWHATKYPARHFEDHDAGLDVLGMVPMRTLANVRTASMASTAPSPMSQAAATAATPAVSPSLASRVTVPSAPVSPMMAAKATVPAAVPAKPAVSSQKKAQLSGSLNAAANRLIRSGGKLARKYPQLSSRFVSLGNRAIKKATQIKGDESLWDMLGSALMFVASTVDDPNWLLNVLPGQIAALNAFAGLADTLNQVSGINDQLTAHNLTDLANQGANLIAQGQQLVNNVDPDNIDPVSVQAINSLQSNINTWMAQAAAALAAPAAAPSPDAGSAGDGGGGGGDSGGGGSSPDWDSMPEATSDDMPSNSGDAGPSMSPEDAKALLESDETPATVEDLDSEGEITPDEASDAYSAAMEDYQNQDSIEGLSFSDYTFQLSDIFAPWQAVQRTVTESQAKEPPPLESAEKPQFQPQPSAKPGTPSPVYARKLAAAQKHLAEVNRQASLYEEDVMGEDDVLDVLYGAIENVVEAGAEPEEAVDIVLEQFEHEITDADPDLVRAHGSMHRGTAYYDSEYPPHGSSKGEEGGLIQPGDTIEVFGENMKDIKVLGCGYSRGLDVLGGAGRTIKPRAGFVMKTSPAGKKYTALVVNKPQHGNHQASIKNARDAGKRAIAVGDKVLRSLSSVKTKVHGAVSPHKAAHHALTAAQLKKLGERAKKAGQEAVSRADKHANLINTLDAHAKSAQQSSAARMGFKGTAIHGLEYDYDTAVLGTMCDMLGQDVATDASTESVADALSPQPTYGLGPAPTTAPALQAGADYAPDPGPSGDRTVYSSDGSVPGAPLPVGYVYYDGSRGYPRDHFGSYNRYYGPGAGSANGGSGFYLSDTGDGWVGRVKPNETGADYEDGRNVPVDTLIQNTLNPYHDRFGHILDFGPLVAAPGDWSDGLRFDMATKQWFWYRDKAPAWATASDDQARLNQAILDYKAQVAAAAADAAAAAAQDKLDADQAAALAKQQALEDAATARRQDQEQTEAQHQAALQDVADQQASQAQAREDERQAAADQRQAELEASMYERATQADAAAEAAAQAAAEDQQASDAAALEDNAPYDDGSEYDDTAIETAASSDEDVMGLSGSRRVKARARNRRS